jgi:hypothetical protein
MMIASVGDRIKNPTTGASSPAFFALELAGVFRYLMDSLP